MMANSSGPRPPGHGRAVVPCIGDGARAATRSTGLSWGQRMLNAYH